MPAIKNWRWLWGSFLALSLLGVSFANDVPTLKAEQARNYILAHTFYSEDAEIERLEIAKCFQEENPFHYCLVHIKGEGWRFLDQNLASPYDVFIFDNGPDYSAEGYYRIQQNGKIGYADALTGKIVIAPIYECAYPFQNGQAKVGLNCQTIKDGEHFYWDADEWLWINLSEL